MTVLFFCILPGSGNSFLFNHCFCTVRYLPALSQFFFQAHSTLTIPEKISWLVVAGPDAADHLRSSFRTGSYHATPLYGGIFLQHYQLIVYMFTLLEFYLELGHLIWEMSTWWVSDPPKMYCYPYQFLTIVKSHKLCCLVGWL